ncbi:MAG TPA: AAA family ATPase, partial [Candidatus Acidoferrales bacterium]|nr:AAA family ATPase [Candidatus Acidoferrales bacterium]
MLKLRKVEILGFKSFCEKTHVTFSGTGLTCIVGPNGCGKSNIVDAISWVLGEQSHKSLRAERMADCIFAGTAKRPPLGMAEVIITLEDPELAEAGKFILTGERSDESSEAHPPAAPAEPSQAAENSPEGEMKLQPQLVVDNTEPQITAEPFESQPDTAPEAVAEQAPADNTPAFLKKKKAAKLAPHVKPGQVVIGRRLYRSGQSEYLVNGRVARLRDIQELFMGVGLGPDSYAIIEQGRIGQILSSKPSDRRAIIEEAAGVTKYKTKKRLAEAKLESSKLNLNRVNDIVVEVEKQLASLKRQASKARRYAEIREQMRGLLRQLMASKAHVMDSETERLAALLEQVTASETESVQSVASLEAEQEKLSSRTYELDTELRQNQNLLGQAMLELDRAENRIAFNRQRGQELDARSNQLTGQIAQADLQVEHIVTRAAEHEQGVTSLRGEKSQLDEIVRSVTTRGYELAATVQQTEEQIALLQRSSTEWNERLHQLHADRAQAEEALAHHSESLGGRESAERSLAAQALEFRERDLSAESHLAAVSGNAHRIADEV